MKTLEFTVIFSLSIHFAYTSINVVNNDAAVDNVVENGDNPLVPSDDEALDSSDFGVEIWEAPQCLPGTCNAHCRRLGHARGVSIGNFCQCRLRSSPLTSFKEEDVQEIEPRNRLGCTMLSCLDICTRLGFRYFRCQNGRCTCWNN